MKRTSKLSGPSIAIALLNRHTGQRWIQEHRFCEGRRWRFDFACLALAIAIEVEGGAYTRGRHTRGAGFVADMEKYNAAVVLGWRVLRYTPQQFNGLAWFKDVSAIAAMKGTT